MATRCHLDEAFLLKVLRDTVNQQILEKEEVQEDLEKRLEAIWDLSIELEAAQAICHFQGLSIFAEAAERGAFKGRLSEICLGIVANVCTLLTPALDLATTALRALESFDASVALQGLRIACALLCSRSSLQELWNDEALDRYLFALENSLRWGLVRYACDAVCQGLLLESDEAVKIPRVLRLADDSLARPQIARLLEARTLELATELLEGESEAGDEAETAWWSALRLAESLAVCQNAEVEATLRSLAIRTVRVAEKPELLVAALEVLAALPQHSEAEAEQKVFSLEPAVVEKLLLLLVDMEEEVDLQEIAWVMLEAADQTDLEEHLEVLNAAASRMTEEVQRKLAPSFLDFLRKCEAAGEKEGRKRCSREELPGVPDLSHCTKYSSTLPGEQGRRSDGSFCQMQG
ncbi:unnamed protein product [Durusdinium trenchii]|uniref:Uncharacterized protein n=1 Tax=Durusdinium trenchii TaxID=1381693 RepID=A0ABP0Q1L7_9DINO